MSIPRAQTGDNAQGARNPLLSAALAYAARGWSIIPTRAKKAAGKWKQFQAGPADETTLRQLFAARHVDGLAVLLGSASGGLVARDFDTMDSYDGWAAANRQAAATLPTVATSRGRHVYFRGPEGFHDYGDGEYRGDPGHYCLLPPARHPSGSVYTWLVPLPDGDLPIIDPTEVGLCNRADGENRDNTDDRADRADTAHTPTLLVSSLSSAPSAPSPSALLHAVESTLPRRAGDRNRKLFDLARQIKAIIPDATPEKLRPIIVDWHRQALPVIGTKGFLETWADFVVAWGRVKYAAGASPVDAAFARAVAATPPEQAVALYAGEPGILLLASLCRELQRMAGTAEFFLDVRTAGRLLNVDHSTAWRWLKVLCADGILQAGEAGTYAVGKATGKASRFRYLGE